MNQGNIYRTIPENSEQESFETLREHEGLRIVRIVSRGQRSPESGWYDQPDNEWVLLLQGGAVLSFDDGTTLRLEAGDFVDIPSHTRHRVDWTDPERETIWLAVHF